MESQQCLSEQTNCINLLLQVRGCEECLDATPAVLKIWWNKHLCRQSVWFRLDSSACLLCSSLP